MALRGPLCSDFCQARYVSNLAEVQYVQLCDNRLCAIGLMQTSQALVDRRIIILVMVQIRQ